MPPFVEQLIASAVPVVGGVWYLASRLGAFGEKVKEHETRITKLERLPERVAKLEVQVER